MKIIVNVSLIWICSIVKEVLKNSNYPNFLFWFLQKQDGKDTSIQKRLSWNYGQHIPTNELSLQQQRLPAPGGIGTGSGRSNKCLSSDSMHSSSGVSSTGSLHLSIGSEWEDSTASTGTVVTATHIYRNLSASTPKDQNDIQNGKH